MSAASPFLALAGGTSMPQFGLGTWPMSDAEAEVAVAEAIRAGYRLIDTAHGYGTEEGVGRGLRAGGVAREELFVTTKLSGAWQGVHEAREALEASAQRLGLDYVDLYLIHWPVPAKDRFVDAWRGLIALRERGLARAIGVSNFKSHQIDRLLAETGVLPDVNQIQLNPLTTRPQARADHAERGIVTQSWSPLGKGVQALMTEQQRLPALAGLERELLDEPVIGEIANAHGRTPGQVVLRWHVQLGLSVVAKSSNPQRLAENIDIFDFELRPAELAAIGGLDRGEGAAVDSDDVET